MRDVRRVSCANWTARMIPWRLTTRRTSAPSRAEVSGDLRATRGKPATLVREPDVEGPGARIEPYPVHALLRIHAPSTRRSFECHGTHSFKRMGLLHVLPDVFPLLLGAVPPVQAGDFTTISSAFRLPMPRPRLGGDQSDTLIGSEPRSTIPTALGLTSHPSAAADTAPVPPEPALT